MSKPIKEMIIEEYKKKFENLDGALVVSVRGIDANDNNTLRIDLQKKDIRVTVIKNSLAKKAFNGTKLEPLSPALDGPSALAYGGESVVDVARELVQWAKKLNELSLKGALIEGDYFDGKAGVKQLSTFPTRIEAQGKVVTLAVSPGRNVCGAIVGPGSMVLGIIKEIETKLEKGEEIKKVA